MGRREHTLAARAKCRSDRAFGWRGRVTSQLGAGCEQDSGTVAAAAAAAVAAVAAAVAATCTVRGPFGLHSVENLQRCLCVGSGAKH